MVPIHNGINENIIGPKKLEKKPATMGTESSPGVFNQYVLQCYHFSQERRAYNQSTVLGTISTSIRRTEVCSSEVCSSLLEHCQSLAQIILTDEFQK